MNYIVCHNCKKKFHVKAGNCPHCNTSPEQPVKEVIVQPEAIAQKPTAPKNKNLTQCKDCGHQVSKNAPACPNCGAVLKKESKPLGCGGLLLIVFIIGVFASIFAGNSTNTSSTATTSPKIETREDMLSKAFSPWDGSHRALEKLIKKTMNDPSSYEHVETKYWDEGDHLIVTTTFRGKNAFGGTVKNWVKAKVALNGNVLAVLEQGP